MKISDQRTQRTATVLHFRKMNNASRDGDVYWRLAREARRNGGDYSRRGERSERNGSGEAEQGAIERRRSAYREAKRVGSMNFRKLQSIMPAQMKQNQRAWAGVLQARAETLSKNRKKHTRL